MRRRDFVVLAAGAPLAAAAPLRAAVPGLAPSIPVRKVGKVETVFKSPGPKPNGLQATEQGLWIMDQGDGNRVQLVTYEGKVLRDFATGADRASGITFDGEAIWLASTYNRQIIKANAMTGETIESYYTPGAGVIYAMAGDPRGRSSPLIKRSPQAQAAPSAATPGHQSEGGNPNGPRDGTGAHGLEWKDGKLWIAVPPSREIYRIDPETWVIDKRFDAPGQRPHGIGWEGGSLWVAESNLNAFFKYNTETGEITEKIQLADSDPLPHGMTIRGNVLWYCDDVGIVCRLQLS
jgi:sugar lactone lactonase YvrE